MYFLTANRKKTCSRIFRYKFGCKKRSKFRGGSCVPGDKKAHNRSSVALLAVSHSMPQRLQNVIKKTKGKSWLLKS